MVSSSLIDGVVDHLADLALWEAELAADPDMIDPLSMASPLVQRLWQVPDPRRLRGLRHPMVVILVLTACATLVAGNDGVTAIRQWAARKPQEVLGRIGARRNPWTGRYLVPSERTFRRVLLGQDERTRRPSPRTPRWSPMARSQAVRQAIAYAVGRDPKLRQPWLRTLALMLEEG